MKEIEKLTVYGTDYTNVELTALVKMLRDKTDGTCGAHISLSERLQRLLDEPCEICDDGRKVERITTIAHNAMAMLEDITNESIMGTDMEDEIGITQEEYDDIM